MPHLRSSANPRFHSRGEAESRVIDECRAPGGGDRPKKLVRDDTWQIALRGFLARAAVPRPRASSLSRVACRKAKSRLRRPIARPPAWRWRHSPATAEFVRGGDRGAVGEVPPRAFGPPTRGRAALARTSRTLNLRNGGGSPAAARPLRSERIPARRPICATPTRQTSGGCGGKTPPNTPPPGNTHGSVLGRVLAF